jgi:hypothetical protein
VEAIGQLQASVALPLGEKKILVTDEYKVEFPQSRSGLCGEKQLCYIGYVLNNN